MRRIGVISDTHGDLQALQAALLYLKKQNCEEIIHTGDVICIGPQSRECLETLLDENVVCLMGNHDHDFVENRYQNKFMSYVATEHKKFVFESIDIYRPIVEKFPYETVRTCGGKKIVFEHYCRPGNGYVSRTGEPFLQLKPYPHMPNVEALDENYRNYDCDVVYYGHQHRESDIVGKKIYVDVGSLCCHPEPLAQGLVIQYDKDNFCYERFAVPYDKAKTEKLMRDEAVPDGGFLFERYFLRSFEAVSKYLKKD